MSEPCFKCGAPADMGFARQYCSNPKCALYLPPTTVVASAPPTPVAGVLRAYRAERLTYTSRNGYHKLRLCWPDGAMTPFDASPHMPGHGAFHDPFLSTSTVLCQFGYRFWTACPMYAAIHHVVTTNEPTYTAYDNGTPSGVCIPF